MKKNNNKKLIGRRQALIFYLIMIALPVIQFCVFYLGSNIYSIVLAFKKFNPLTGGYEWNGLNNFKTFIYNVSHAPELLIGVKNSFLLWVVGNFINVPGSLLLSYYIFKKYKFHKTFRFFLFLPSMITSMVMLYIYQYFVIQFFPMFGLPNFFELESTQFLMAVIYEVWIGFSANIILYSGSMGGIPKELFEAADIDGASELRKIAHIVFPHMYPLLSLFFAAGLPGMITSGGPIFLLYSTSAPLNVYTVGYWLQMNILAGDAGYPIAIASGLVITAFSFPVVMIARKLFKKYGPSED